MGAARTSGLRAVGVLTGAYNARALRAAGADDVLVGRRRRRLLIDGLLPSGPRVE